MKGKRVISGFRLIKAGENQQPLSLILNIDNTVRQSLINQYQTFYIK